MYCTVFRILHLLRICLSFIFVASVIQKKAETPSQFKAHCESLMNSFPVAGSFQIWN